MTEVTPERWNRPRSGQRNAGALSPQRQNSAAFAAAGRPSRRIQSGLEASKEAEARNAVAGDGYSRQPPPYPI